MTGQPVTGQPVTGQPVTGKINIVSTVSDPPKTISASDLAQIQEASERLHAAFAERTARMEILSADDLRVRVK